MCIHTSNNAAKEKMFDQLKSILRRFPLVYRGVQRIYYLFLFVLERFAFGSSLHAWIWRHRQKDDVETLRKNAMHPHRSMLVDAVRRFQTFEDVLEFGCHSGPNLFRLAREFPHARFKGIDLNMGFIDQGQAWMAEEGLDNVELKVGSSDDLSNFPSRSADVVISDAVLMYLGPDKIAQVLHHFVRIARKGIILVEWSLDADDSQGHYWYDMHWVHNYSALLRAMAPTVAETRTKIPADVWPGSGWEEYGYVMCFYLNEVRASFSHQ